MDIIEVLVTVIVYYVIFKKITDRFKDRRKDQTPKVERRADKVRTFKEVLEDRLMGPEDILIPENQTQESKKKIIQPEKIAEIPVRQVHQEGFGPIEEEWNPPVGSLPPREMDLLGNQPTTLEVEWMEQQMLRDLQLGITPLEKETGYGEGGQEEFIIQVERAKEVTRPRFTRDEIRSGLIFHEILSQPKGGRTVYKAKTRLDGKGVKTTSI